MGIWLIENINVGIETEAAGRAIPTLGIFVSNYRYCVFGVNNGTCIVQAASVDIYYSEDRR
jgi:hypothetical protein